MNSLDPRRRGTLQVTTVGCAVLHVLFAVSWVSNQVTQFAVIAAPSVADRISDISLRVRSSLERLAPLFPGTPTRQFFVHLHRGHETLPADVGDTLHPGTPGVAQLSAETIHLFLGDIRLAGPTDIQTVLDHEVAHILLHQYAGEAGRFVPRWFHEGIAQVLSGSIYLGSSEESLVYAAHTGRLLRLSSLRKDFPADSSGRRQAYAQTFSFVSFLVRSVGLETVIRAAKLCTNDDGYRAGFVATTGTPLGYYEDQWVDYLKHESGAAYRAVLDNCFSYVSLIGFVLLALAGIRRWRRDAEIRQRLERAESHSSSEVVTDEKNE
jgi:hypothetical protein